MAIAEVNGQRLYYEVHGEGEPLLCVMGLACDTLVWLPQIRPSRRRTGRSSSTTATSASPRWPTATTRSPTWRPTRWRSPTLELDSFHLLGISMGGAIAQEVALAAPERVRTLTLAVTFRRRRRLGAPAGRVWGARVDQISREQHVDELMLLNHSEAIYENPEMVESCARRCSPTRTRSRARLRAPARGARPPRRARAPRLADDAGPRDRRRARHARARLEVERDRRADPGAQLTVLQGAPTALNLERAEEFNAAVLDFLSEAAATPAA